MICDYYIHKTDLADISSFKKINLEFLAASIEISFTGNLQLEQFVLWETLLASQALSMIMISSFVLLCFAIHDANNDFSFCFNTYNHLLLNDF